MVRLYPGPDAETTAQLIALAAQATGFMSGAVGSTPQGWHGPEGDRHDFLRRLDGELLRIYPEAGAAFRAVQLFTNLLWQPAYLLLIGAHAGGQVPDLAGLSQQQEGIFVQGYRLAPAPAWSGTPEAMIVRAAQQLRGFADRLLAELNAHEKLRPIPAQRLVAERMLSILVWLLPQQSAAERANLSRWSQLWLEEAGVAGQGALQAVPLPQGGEVLVTRRKGCCLDYRIDAQRLCPSCPKQDEATRITRQVAQALARKA